MLSHTGQADASIARLLVPVVVQKLEERRRPLQSRQTSSGTEVLVIRGIAKDVSPQRRDFAGIIAAGGSMLTERVARRRVLGDEGPVADHVFGLNTLLVLLFL